MGLSKTAISAGSTSTVPHTGSLMVFGKPRLSPIRLRLSPMGEAQTFAIAEISAQSVGAESAICCRNSAGSTNIQENHRDLDQYTTIAGESVLDSCVASLSACWSIVPQRDAS